METIRGLTVITYVQMVKLINILSKMVPGIPVATLCSDRSRTNTTGNPYIRLPMVASEDYQW